MAQAPHPPDSLVQYDPPLLVSTEGTQTGQFSPAKVIMEEDDNLGSSSEAVLYKILPKREWAENSGRWMQNVSSVPSSRIDVINLQEHLDWKLMHRQARTVGICPIREDLHSQLFGACRRACL